MNFGYFDNWLFTFGEKARSQFSFIRAFGSIVCGVTSIFIAAVISGIGFLLWIALNGMAQNSKE